MRLAMKDLRWEQDIAEHARRHGWTVFGQGRPSVRPEDPTFMATKGGAVIAVWLRSASVRPSRVPPLDRFAGTGVRCFCWSPVDLPKAMHVLLTADVAPGGADGAA